MISLPHRSRTSSVGARRVRCAPHHRAHAATPHPPSIRYARYTRVPPHHTLHTLSSAHCRLSLQDGQFKKTASNAKLRRHLPDYRFMPIKDGITSAVKWFVEHYDEARK